MASSQEHPHTDSPEHKKKLAGITGQLKAFALSTLMTKAVHLPIRVLKNIILTRFLGPSGRGIYSLFIAIPELIAAIGNLGFGLGSLYLSTHKKVPLKTILGNCLVYLVIQGLVLGIAGYVLMGAGNRIGFEAIGDLEPIKFLLIAAIPLYLAHRTLTQLLLAVKAIHFINILSLVYSTLPVVCLFIFWVLTGNALLSAALSWITGATIVVALFLYKLLKLTSRHLSVNLEQAKQAFTYGARGSVHTLASQITRRVDLLLIAYFLGPAATGYYAVSVSIAEILLALSDSVVDPFLPIRLETDHHKGRQLTSKVTRYLLFFMFLACILTALFGKLIILILFGASFFPAYKALVCLLPGMLFLSVYPILQADIYSLNRPGLVSMVSVGSMVCNIILNFMLIPPLGISGAAIASSISYFLSTLLLLLFFSRRYDQSVRSIVLMKKEDFGRLREKTVTLWPFNINRR